MKYEKVCGRIVGTKQYLDVESGETVEAVNVIKPLQVDKGFHKVWLYDLMDILTEIGSKKIMVVEYLLSKMNPNDNGISLTVREAAGDLKVSPVTVNQTIQALMKANFLKRIRNGYYLVNPGVLIQGTYSKRQRVMIEYREAAVQLDMFRDEKEDKVA